MEPHDDAKESQEWMRGRDRAEGKLQEIHAGDLYSVMSGCSKILTAHFRSQRQRIIKAFLMTHNLSTAVELNDDLCEGYI